jgi:hypothetical protein
VVWIPFRLELRGEDRRAIIVSKLAITCCVLVRVNFVPKKKVFLAMSVLILNELVGLLPVVRFTPAGEKLLGIMMYLIV